MRSNIRIALFATHVAHNIHGQDERKWTGATSILSIRLNSSVLESHTSFIMPFSQLAQPTLNLQTCPFRQGGPVSMRRRRDDPWEQNPN